MELIISKLNELELLLKRQSNLSKELLTLEEASQYLQVSKSCLHKKTSRKELPHYVPGGKKIYFRKTELDAWVFNSRITAVDEINLVTQDYLCRTSKIDKP